MHEFTRTLTFVAVAALALLLGWAGSRDTSLTPDEYPKLQVGKEFYPDFKDPTAPDQIRVVMVDEERAEAKTFEVKLSGGRWTIPSHYNYPADGKDRLAKTAASVIAIRRGDVASTSKNDQEKLGVLDPLNLSGKQLKGYGRRVTLSQKGQPLVDLIIGKELQDRPGYYFTRLPNEEVTFVSQVNIDLSTKFNDWVETDLLKFDRDDLRTITIDNSHVDVSKQQIVKVDESTLTREKSADPWKLDKHKDADGELDTAKINDLINTLDDLKLTGVRPKPEALKLALKREGDGRVDIREMMDKGFFPSSRGAIVGGEGELVAMTGKGIVYQLQFGNAFVGDDFEIETGLTKKSDKKDKDDAKKDDKASKKGGRYMFVRAYFNEDSVDGKPVKPRKPSPPAAEEPAEKTPSKTEKPEGEPTAKKAPEKPEEKSEDKAKPEVPMEGDKKDDAKPEDKKEEAKPEEKKSDGGDNGGAQDEPKKDAAGEKKADDEKPAEPKAEDKKPAEEKPAEKTDDKKGDDPQPDDKKPADDKKPGDKAEEKKPGEEKPEKTTEEKPAASKPGETKPETKAAEPKKSAADLQKEYEQALKKYETDLAAWKKKVKDGEEEADKLNRRFADWYYVISADDFAKLRLSRKDLVKAKTPPAGEKGDNPFPELKGDESKDKTESKDKAESKTSDEPKSEPEEKEKPEAKKSDDEPKTESKPEKESPRTEDKKGEPSPEPKAEDKTPDDKTGEKPEASTPEEKKPEEKSSEEKKPE